MFTIPRDRRAKRGLHPLDGVWFELCREVPTNYHVFHPLLLNGGARVTGSIGSGKTLSVRTFYTFLALNSVHRNRLHTAFCLSDPNGICSEFEGLATVYVTDLPGAKLMADFGLDLGDLRRVWFEFLLDISTPSEWSFSYAPQVVYSYDELNKQMGMDPAAGEDSLMRKITNQLLSDRSVGSNVFTVYQSLGVFETFDIATNYGNLWVFNPKTVFELAKSGVVKTEDSLPFIMDTVQSPGLAVLAELKDRRRKNQIVQFPILEDYEEAIRGLRSRNLRITPSELVEHHLKDLPHTLASEWRERFEEKYFGDPRFI